MNLFTNLSKREVSKIDGAGVLQSMKRNEVVFRKGDLGTEFFVIMDGKVLVVDEFEGQMQALARLETGDCFGEMALFSRVERSATVVCEQDGMLLVLDEARLQKLIEKKISGKFLVNLSAILASRLRMTNAHYMKARYGKDKEWVLGQPTPKAEKSLDRNWVR